jgi:predicted amidohydrolase/uncharacterized protein (DUF952 family)
MNTQALYHLLSQSEWNGRVSPGPDGFVHFSYAHQWRLSWQRYLRNCPDPLLLELRPSPDWDLRVENGFPHLYGEFARADVVEQRTLPPLRDLRLALLSELSPSAQRLLEVSQAADLVVLPELPFQPWAPARQGNALPSADLDHQLDLCPQLAILGGGVVGRSNRAVLMRQGEILLDYTKMHLPQEEGFWESDYYDPGQLPPQVCDALGFPLGVQICSDIHRPFGLSFLAFQGVSLVLCPRATEKATYPAWKRVYQAMARIHSCYIASVNRPGPEAGVPLGGPSLVVGPDGEVVAESDESLLLVTIEHDRIVRAKNDYPGYLNWAWPTYQQAWG